MRKVTNYELINKRARISTWASAIGFALLIGSLFIGYDGIKMYLSLLATIASFIIVMMGSQLAKSFTGRPRPDEWISKGLKGISNEYTLYNHITPVNHLLIGSSGVWVINAKRSRGTFFYEPHKNRYRHVGGGVLVQYLKLFGLEGIGNPEKDAVRDTKKITELFTKHLGKPFTHPVNNVTVIVDELSTVDCPEAPVPTIHIKALREYMAFELKNSETKIPTAELAEMNAIFAEKTKLVKAYAKEHDEK